MNRMRIALASAVSMGMGLASLGVAQASDYYGADDDAPIVSRRVVVEERTVVRPRPVVREVVREVLVDRPVVYRPRPVAREIIVERDHFARPRGPRPVGYGYGYGFDD